MLEQELKHLHRDLCQFARETTFLFDSLGQSLQSTATGSDPEMEKGKRETEELKNRIDHTCLVLLALREPYGLEFRRVISTMKTTESLVRIIREIETISALKRFGSGFRSSRLKEDFMETSRILNESIHAAIHVEPDQARELSPLCKESNNAFFRIEWEQVRSEEALIHSSLKNIRTEILSILESVIFEALETDKLPRSANQMTHLPSVPLPNYSAETNKKTAM